MRNRIRLIARFPIEAGIRCLVPLMKTGLRYKRWINKGLENFYKIIMHHNK